MIALSTQKKNVKQSNNSNLLFGVLATSLVLGSLTACNRPTEPAAPTASITIGTEVDDAVLTTKVKSALIDDEYVKSLDIKVETFKADVMLSGFVDTQAQMDRSVEVAKAIIGVRNVNNKLSLKDGTQSVGNKIDDTVITASVKAAMLADPILKSREVSVVTVKGEVQLSGYVDSETQISHATGVAKTVDGVVNVVNHMSVKK